jgi:hypothetical protein
MTARCPIRAENLVMLPETLNNLMKKCYNLNAIEGIYYYSLSSHTENVILRSVKSTNHPMFNLVPLTAVL